MTGRPAGADTGPLVLDGSHDEGGGQILRTALGLAVAVGRPLRIARIRARRPRPGLQPQHLTVVRALAQVSGAAVSGDALDSTEVSFDPGAPRGGEYRFDIGAVKGSAGSVTLLFQALLLALLRAPRASHLVLAGGTHVPWSPPFHYLADVFLPAVGAAGVEARIALRRWGWYPAGGGEMEAWIEPSSALRGLTLAAAPRPVRLTGVSAVSRLPRSIAERQRRRAEDDLRAAGLDAEVAVHEETAARSPGTLLFLAAAGRAGFSALGRRGLPAEAVADAAVAQACAWAKSGAAVDDHLADQLVPFLALAGAPSAFTCPTISGHLRTVAWVVEQCLPVRVDMHDGPPALVEIRAAPFFSSLR